MDWSKTQTVFIVIFLVLNIALYNLYHDRMTATEDLDIIADKSIELRLKEDEITVEPLPRIKEGDLYISGKPHTFMQSELMHVANQNFYIEEDGETLISSLTQPVTLDEISGEELTTFVKQYVYNGDQYVLSEIDDDQQQATFFQKVNERPIYYDEHAMLTVEWNKDKLVRSYEMTMLSEMEPFEHQAPLVEPIAIIEKLYLQKLIEPKDHIVDVSIGYTFMSELSQREVFVATWELRVENDSLKTTESFFVNAVDGTLLNIATDDEEQEEEEE